VLAIDHGQDLVAQRGGVAVLGEAVREEAVDLRVLMSPTDST
jgi:hypothetical protein